MSGTTGTVPAEQFELVLAAARGGEPWALELLYRHLAGPVVAYLRLQGVEDPEDLSSEVFLGVFRGLDRFDGLEADFRSWVFAIAHRRVIDDRRRRSRRVLTSSHDRAPDVAGLSDTETEALAGLESERIRDLCGRLSPDQRDVVLLRLVGDMSVEEVAAALGKRPGAVKALQHRAVEALRKDLSGEIPVGGVSA